MKFELGKRLEVISLFLRWWLAQLRACAHDLANILMESRRRTLSVYWNASRLLIVDEGAAQSKVLVEAPNGAWPEERPAELEAAQENHGRVRLFVSPRQAFVRQVQVPIAVLPHLDSALVLQLPKLLPLDATELMTDFAIAATDPGKNIVVIDLVALKKADIDPVLERLRRWRAQVVSTHLGEPSEPTQRFRFSDSGVSHRGRNLKRSDRVMIGVAATLGLACASVAATESYRSHVSLQDAREATRVTAAMALMHRQELLARLEPLRALTVLEAAPSTSALLADLTVLVPQNTYLTTLELQHNHVRIVGVSPNSGSVVKLLSSSKLLHEVALRSSMSVGVGTGLDRFEVTAELKEVP